jgi:Lipoprotein LpqB beta-propeller domain/Sporulation and spore germination
MAVVASLAGCVGMPDSGSPGTFGATPQGTTSDFGFIGAIPAGPAPGWTPSEIVAGFLNANASVSYPTYKDVAKEYLVSSAANTWIPNWSVKVVDKINPPLPDIQRDGRHATVTVSGTAQASFNGSGQYVGAQQSGAQLINQQFHLVKVNGLWRITNPLPQGRLLTQPDFASVYKPQDLYFFDSYQQVLVPDSVFVPAGTSPTSLVTNLVGALLGDPQSQWLETQTSPIPPAVTAFLPHTNISVAIDGTTATVNLTGPGARTTNNVLEQISAQLVWTLTGQQESTPIQAVELEVNGDPWIPPTAPCAGTGGQSLGPAQKLAMYSCYNPYPAVAPTSFYYVGHGQAWSRCAAESQVTAGSISSVLAVFGRTGAAKLNQSCGSSVQASSTLVPPPQPHSVPALSWVTVAPGSQYAAGVSADGKTVYMWASGGAKPSNSITTSGVTAINWDRSGYLWLAQGSTTWAIPQTSNSGSGGQIPNAFTGKITGLGIAPDGVRVAAITQTALGRQLELAAIDHGGQAASQRENPTTRTSTGPTSIGDPVRLGPNITDPIALTWYDADDLLVLDGMGNGSTLWEVPVDGQPATKLPGVLPGAVSITADGPMNALVLGLSGGGLEVSASLEGPWQPLGSGGQNPVFPASPHPAPAQS